MSRLSHTQNACVLISVGILAPVASCMLEAKNTQTRSDTKSQPRSGAVHLHSLLVSNWACVWLPPPLAQPSKKQHFAISLILSLHNWNMLFPFHLAFNRHICKSTLKAEAPPKWTLQPILPLQQWIVYIYCRWPCKCVLKLANSNSEQNRVCAI